MKLGKVFKRLLLATIALIWGSGLVVWALGLWFQVDRGLGPEPRPARVGWLEAHAVAGLFFFCLFGYLYRAHVEKGWRTRLKRRSGIAAFASLALLLASVPGLYYVADERLKSLIALGHTYLGLALLVPVLWHWLSPRGRRKFVP